MAAIGSFGGQVAALDCISHHYSSLAFGWVVFSIPE
jgi:hypothetical protein